uniref:Uncharacterized protein n=1 Tax=Xanthomonas citri pv. phaseoli var. fuscans TaxID=473423 RepID=A0AB33F536_XANCI
MPLVHCGACAPHAWLTTIRGGGGSASISTAQQLRIAPTAQLFAWRAPLLIGRPESAPSRRCVHGSQTERCPATFWQAQDRRVADPQTGAGLH